jgi:Flp pilus assembly protein TadD/predicted nucleic acid-binding Zn ribbon protein
MVKCKKCSTEIAAGERFCTGCGTVVETASSTREKFCTNCGAALDPKNRFCVECGSEASVAAPPPGAVAEDSGQPEKIPTLSKVIEPAPVSIAAKIPEKPEPTETVRFNQIETPPSAPPQPAASHRPVEPESQDRPKQSNGKLMLLTVVAVVIIALGAWLTKSGTKSESAAVANQQSQRKAESSPAKALVAEKPADARALVDAVTKGDAERFEALLADIRRVPAAEAGDSRIARKLNEAALMAIREKSYAQAIDALRKAVAADAADIEAANNLGYALHLAGQYREAEEQLLRVIAQSPDRAVAWANLATTSSKLGKSRQAVAAYVTAHKFQRDPEGYISALKRIAEAADDDAVKKDIGDAMQKLEAQR